MITKIISIKNVGRFKNSAAPGNPELARYTLIVGANGFGKTTICAVLRSLKSGDVAPIVGRRTLGAEGPPSVELLLNGRPARFDGATWSATDPSIAIFDGVFVSENIHSGEVIDVDHRRNLYRVIIGEEGVRLAEEDSRHAAQSREKTSEINAAGRAIQPHIPGGMDLNEFIGLRADPEIDARISDQERAVEAVRQAKQINERRPLSEITIPTMPEGFVDLLARTIDDIAQDAETRLAEHLAVHRMKAEGGNWIAKGLPHAEGETCPFCGQDIQDLPPIAAFRSIFSKRYKALRDDITAMRAKISEQFGDRALGGLNTLVEQNRGSAEFWGRFCNFDPTPLTFPEDISEAMRDLAQAALALLDRKDRAPLEPIQPDAAFDSAASVFDGAQARAQEIAEAIRAVNILIAMKKRETGAADVYAAEAELARRRAIKVRHAEPVPGLCADHGRLSEEKRVIDERKAEIRVRLDEHTKNVMQPYERLINKYLEAFHADFSITETKHGYPGGMAASSYQLVINDTAIELGDGRTPPDQPSFRNTLSSGDRTTLALAFFLACLEQDQALANKVVVFDDPFNSQDAFRRLQTVHEIARVARGCGQVIVLSHDATFLRQVWEKAPAAERVALTLADHRVQGSKITLVDLKRASQGRTATDIDDLHTYLTTGAGNLLDLIRKMRVVLETYCWTTYPASFQADNDWLGDIVGKIRQGGDQHPAKDLTSYPRPSGSALSARLGKLVWQ
jgi:wobble nucleotide-excising tRNase